MSEEINKQVEELYKQIDELKDRGVLNEALTLSQKAVEISRDSFGVNNLTYAKSLHVLADIYHEIGKLDLIEPLLWEAIKIRKRILGYDDDQNALSYNNLGNVYREFGRYDDAVKFHRKARDYWEQTQGKENIEYIKCLSNMAIDITGKGDYISAEPLYDEAEELWRRVGGEDNYNYTRTLANKANLYYETGNYNRAELLLKKAIEIERKVLGENHPGLASSLHNLANIYLEIGNYDSAEKLYLQVKEIKFNSIGDKHYQYADTLNNLADVYFHKNNYIAAESLYLLAREIYFKTIGENHPYYAIILHNLAEMYKTIDKYEVSENYYVEADKILSRTLYDTHPFVIVNLNGLSDLYLQIGNYEKCKGLITQAMDNSRDKLYENHPWSVENQLTAVKLLVATGFFDEGYRIIKQAIATYNRMIIHTFAFCSENQRMDYIKKIQPSFDIFLSLINKHFSGSPEAIRYSFDLVIRRKAITAEALASQRDTMLSGKHPELRNKFNELTMLRMQIALKTFKGPGPEGKEEHDKLINEWSDKKERIESELSRQIPEINLEERLRDADRIAVAKALPKDSVLIEFVKFNEYDFKAIPAKGEKQWKPARYIAFVLLSDKPDQVAMIDLGESETIDKMIRDFRSSIISEIDSSYRSATSQSIPPSVSQTSVDSIALRKAVFDTLSDAIGSCKHILISPDGDISRLPFEVLPTDNNKYLIDDYQMSYLSVGRDVLRFAAESSGTSSDALVAADPDFDLGTMEKHKEPVQEFALLRGWRTSRDFDRASLRFERLPGTRPESDKVSNILKTKPWLEDKVLEGKLKSVHSPFILHLATHGFFLEDQKIDPSMEKGPRYENPLLRSGLALAGANTSIKGGTLPDEAEDGLLTAEDVSGLDLTNTEIVVLSACDTGLGEIRTGEGVFGLRRAFMLAGAKTLVMSLWKVADLTTPIIMGRFYDNLLNKKLPRDESLREAQLYLRGLTIKEIRKKWLTKDMISKLSSGNDKIEHELEEFLKLPDETTPFSDPLYWGAFICQGDPSPIKTGG